jgi:thioredoxin
MSTTHRVNDATFDKDVLQSELPVLVDFWATWCAPCRLVAPVLEDIAGQLRGKLLVAKVDVDESPRVASRFRIQSIPTFILFDRGKSIGSMQGAQPKARFLQFLETHLSSMKGSLISVAELDRRLKAGEAIHLFDIRDPRDFARSHLRKARCVAPEDLDRELAALPPDEPAVLVCRTGERSKAEAQRFENGGREVLALEKGLLEWEGSRRPTYSTEEERALEAS